MQRHLCWAWHTVKVEVSRLLGRILGRRGSDGDWDALVGARIKPRPPLSSGAVAIDEPDE